MSKPSLSLHAELVAADGTRYRWASERTDPANVPTGISFASKRFEGWERGSAQLTRPIARDWLDLGLFDGFTLVGYDGSVAYEGMLGQVPRSTPHGIGVETTGWMAHSRHRKFRAVYVDADKTRWQEAPLDRRAEIAAAGSPQGKVPASAAADGLVWDVPNEQIPLNEHSELWYALPPGVHATTIIYRGARSGTWTGFEAPTLYGSNVKGVTGLVSTALTLDNTLRFSAALSTACRYLFLRTLASGGPVTPPAGTQQRYPVAAVYGTHGLTVHESASSTSDPWGFYASDIIRDICSRFCPRLNTAGVKDTTWVVSQAAWHDRTDPYDAWLDLNRYHLWELEVWEDRTLHYRPSDLRDYQWEVRTTDPGVQVDLQGDSTDHLANYAVVQFVNTRTGEQDEVSPDTHPELRDESAENPANRHGLDVEFGITLSSPENPDAAAQIGRAALAEHNQPRAVGTITFKGHIRDRAGHWQPGWKVRAGETVAITDWPNNRPRLIGEAAWDHQTKTGTVAVDSTLKRIDAYLDRLNTSLRAAGLGG